MSQPLPQDTLQVLQQVVALKRANVTADDKEAHVSSYEPSPGVSEAASPLAGREAGGGEGGGCLNDAELHLITSVVSQVLSQSNLAGLLSGSSGAGAQQGEGSPGSAEAPTTPLGPDQQHQAPPGSSSHLQTAAAAAAARAIAQLQAAAAVGAGSPPSPLHAAPPSSPVTPAAMGGAGQPGSPGCLTAPPSSPCTPPITKGSNLQAASPSSLARHRLSGGPRPAAAAGSASPASQPHPQQQQQAGGSLVRSASGRALDPQAVLARYASGEAVAEEQLEALGAAEHALEEELQMLDSRHRVTPGDPGVSGGTKAGLGLDAPMDELLDALAAAAPGQDLIQLLGEELAAALGIDAATLAAGGANKQLASAVAGSSGAGQEGWSSLEAAREARRVDATSSGGGGSPGKGAYPVFQQPGVGREAATYTGRLMAATKGSDATWAGAPPPVLEPAAAREAARSNMHSWRAEGGYMMVGAAEAATGQDQGQGQGQGKVGGKAEGGVVERPPSRGKGKGLEAPRRLSQFEKDMQWQQGLRVYAAGESSGARAWGGEGGGSGGRGRGYEQPITPRTEARFELLYQRALDWQQRKEHLREVVRAEREAAEAAACTFSPVINKYSKRMLRNGISYPRPRIQPDTPSSSLPSTMVRPGSAWSSGRTATRPRSTSPTQQRPGSAAGRMEGQSPDQTGEVDQTKATIRQAVINALGEEDAEPVLSMLFGGDAQEGSDQSSAPKTPAVCQRLYEQAQVWEQRRQQRAMLTAELERAARSFSAPRSARKVTPRVYDWYTGPAEGVQRTRTLPTGLEECTFHPVTNSRGRSRSRNPQGRSGDSSSPYSSGQSPDATTPTASGNSPSHQQQQRGRSPLGQRQGAGQDSWLSGLDLDSKEAVEQLQALHATGLISTEELHEALEAEEERQVAAAVQQQQQQAPQRVVVGGGKALALSSHPLNTSFPPPHHEVLSPGSSLTELVNKATQSAAAAIAASQMQRSAGPLRRAGSPAADARPASRQQSPGSPRGHRVTPVVTPAEDLDWQEFIERQETFLAAKNQRLEVMRSRAPPPDKPQLSPGSVRILRQKQAAAAAVSAQQQQQEAGGGGSPLGGSPYLERMQRQLTSFSLEGSPHGSPRSPSATRRQAAAVAASSGEWSFRPSITKLGARQKPRSMEDMSEGERLRREAKLESARRALAARELEGATFRPQLAPDTRAGAYGHVKPHLNLKQPEAYMAQVQEQRRRSEEARARARMMQQVAELQECTFRPATTPVPGYLQDLAEVGYTARFIEGRLADALAMRSAGQPGGNPYGNSGRP